jgi:ketosteroid isomerase-like protein
MMTRPVAHPHGLACLPGLRALGFVALGFVALGFVALGSIALGTVSWATPPLHSSEPTGADEAAVVAAVEAFLDALNAKDGPRLAATLAPGAVFHSAAENPRTGPIVVRTGEEFVALVVRSPNELHERKWDPEVRIQGRIATVWAPYDFWIDGTFSHCGIDAFNLVQTEDGWRISSAVYTTEREGCEPSPLGPLSNL